MANCVSIVWMPALANRAKTGECAEPTGEWMKMPNLAKPRRRRMTADSNAIAVGDSQGKGWQINYNKAALFLRKFRCERERNECVEEGGNAKCLNGGICRDQVNSTQSTRELCTALTTNIYSIPSFPS
jgi:hypothetical protein